MKYVGNILYFDTADMQEIGVAYDAIKKAIQRGSQIYSTIKDPTDSRRILVEYDRLKPDLKLKAQQWLGECPHQWYTKQWIKAEVQLDAGAWDFMRRHEVYGKGLSDQDKEKYYQACCWLNMISRVAEDKHLLKSHNLTKADFWTAVCKLIKLYEIALPSDYSRLTQKIRQYKSYSYRAVIKEGNYGSDNRTIINDEVADWLVAQYSLPIKMDVSSLYLHYNQEAVERGWKPISDESTIYKFLNDPLVMQQWYGPRHGHRLAVEKYGYTLRTKLPTLRDALWYSDATKLNFFDSTGKLRASYMVYEIMDVYSEALLGYHIAPTENHEMQYHAFKMAIKTSGQKPYELRTDNQGGHKRIKSFLDKISRLNIRTQPHNGKSKTIENAFYRFQHQHMRKHWFFTGQNITSKKMNSRANMEFVIAHLKHLPTQEEIKQVYAECRNQWNNAKHPKHDSTRIELYLNSHNPKAVPVDYLDMIDLFWIDTKSPVTYYTHGIQIEVGGVTYEYEVLKDNLPDQGFRQQHIGRKFAVKYDPENMDHIRLYLPTDKGLEYIAIAQSRLFVPRALQDYEPGDALKIRTLLNVRKEDSKRLREQAREREDRTGIKAEDLLQQIDSLGQYQKVLSNMDSLENDFSPQSILNMI